MSKDSQFSGLELDQLFQKAYEINDVQNGWTKLVSAADTLLNLNMVTNAGNYSVDYWANGPSALSTYIGCGPLSLVNYQENEILRQYAFFFGITYDGYTRTYNPQSKTFSEWKSAKLHENTSVGAAAPSNPTDNQVWVDTTNASAPVFKYYDASSATWKEVLPGDAMRMSVYDSANKGTDFFAYADAEIAKVDSSSIYGGQEIDYIGHITDSTIHASAQDIANWEGKASNTKFAAAIETAKETLQTEVATAASVFGDETTTMNADIEDMDGEVDDHVSNQLIHLRDPKMFTFSRAGEYLHHLGVAMVTVNDTIYVFEASLVNGSYQCNVYTTIDGTTLTSVGTLDGFDATDVNYMTAKVAGSFIYLMTTDTTYILSTSAPTAIAGQIFFKCYDVVMGNGEYLISTDSGILKSTDGTTFTDFAVVGTSGCYLAYTSGIFMIASFDGTVKYMIAGENTLNSCTLTGVTKVHGITTLSNQFVIVTNTGVFVTSDCVAFIPATTNPPITLNADVAYTLKSLVSDGSSAFGIYTYNMHQYAYWSSDGLRWSMQDLGVTSADLARRVYPQTLIVAPDGSFKVCGFVGIYSFTSYNSSEDYLDQKSAADHTHVNDGTVKVRTSDIQGVLKAEQVPDEVKEINVEVEDWNALLALTILDVQNGDFVWVKKPSDELPSPLLYIVSDQTKLGTMDAFRKYSTGGTAMQWNNIDGIPDSITGLGITDLPIKTEIDDKIDALAAVNADTDDELDIAQAKADLMTPANINAAVKLQSDLDTAQTKLNLILNYTV